MFGNTMLALFFFALVYAWYANCEIKGRKWHKQRKQWFFRIRDDVEIVWGRYAFEYCDDCERILFPGGKPAGDVKTMTRKLCRRCRKMVLHGRVI